MNFCTFTQTKPKPKYNWVLALLGFGFVVAALFGTFVALMIENILAAIVLAVLSLSLLAFGCLLIGQPGDDQE